VRPAPPEDDDIQAVNPLVGLAVMGAGMPADGSMVYLSPAPLYHAAPLGWCTTAHRLGGTVVVMEKFDPESALATIEKYNGGPMPPDRKIISPIELSKAAQLERVYNHGLDQ
jgi:fatty-acyl-CoA synthase